MRINRHCIAIKVPVPVNHIDRSIPFIDSAPAVFGNKFFVNWSLWSAVVMRPNEFPVELLDLRHHHIVKEIGPYPCLSKTHLPLSRDFLVWIEHPNYDPTNFSFNQPLSTWNFRVIARSAWF